MVRKRKTAVGESRYFDLWTSPAFHLGRAGLMRGDGGFFFAAGKAAAGAEWQLG